MKKLFTPIKPYKLSMAVIASMFILSSCEKESFTNVEETYSVELKNADVDQSRFNDFTTHSSSAVITKKNMATRSMPAAPSIPEDARNMFNVDGKGNKYQTYNATKGTYYVPESQTWSEQIELKNGVDFYVAGTLTLKSWGSGSTIYVLPGGKIITPSTLDNVDIKTWGETEVNTGFSLNANSIFENYGGELNLKGTRISGYFVSYNNVKATTFYADTNKKYDVVINGGLEVTDNVELSNNVTLEVATYLNAKKFNINTHSRLFVGCMDIKENLSISNNSTIYLDNYINANNIQFNEGVIFLEAGGMIEVASKIVLSNTKCRIENFSDKDYSVVKCGQLDIYEDEINRFGGAIDLHTASINNLSGKELRWTANVIFNGNTYLPANECRPEFGQQPVTPSEPQYILNHIAEILPPSNVSATSVDVEDNKVYISWHEKDDNYQGYIDVANVGELRLNNTLHTDALDFNHISVSNGKVLVAGGAKKGAIYTEVNYAESGSNLLIDIKKVNGSSANCILEDGSKTWVISGANGGITEFPSANFTQLNEAKYVVKYGANLAVLAGINSTSVYEYDTNGSLIKSYAVGSIPTADGKNTLLADGETLYVALGDNGLKAFINGQQAGEWRGESGSVNSIAVDADYIYVANGVAGLYILDKKTFNVLKSYKLGGASANFVKKGDDGNIYVAYGAKGVHAFKLNRV